MTPQQVMTQALAGVDFAYWEDRLFHSPQDCADLAAEVLAALPKGWQLESEAQRKARWDEGHAFGFRDGHKAGSAAERDHLTLLGWHESIEECITRVEAVERE